MSLDLDTLRGANIARLPEFKNKHGELAHSKHDGSDWSPAQWFQALIGEVGEYAQVRLDYEHGNTTNTEMRIESAKELADVTTYLDILARRAYDETEESDTSDPAQVLMWLMACLGSYANTRKKFERGDLVLNDYVKAANEALSRAYYALGDLASIHVRQAKAHQVTHADLNGVNLSNAVISKFNEVSKRVSSRVFIETNGDDWNYVEIPPIGKR